MDTWLSRRCRAWSMRLFWYCPARKGTAYSLSLQSVRMCSAVLLYPGRLQRNACIEGAQHCTQRAFSVTVQFVRHEGAEDKAFWSG